MNIQTVPAVLNENKVPTGDLTKVAGNLAYAGITAQENSAMEIGDANDNFRAMMKGQQRSFVIATPDGKVDGISLNGMLVNSLFNAADMDASAFVQQFISAYNIPEMKVSDDRLYWTYTSPVGVKISINKEKGLVLEKVASAQDRKQSFN